MEDWNYVLSESTPFLMGFVLIFIIPFFSFLISSIQLTEKLKPVLEWAGSDLSIEN